MLRTLGRGAAHPRRVWVFHNKLGVAKSTFQDCVARNAANRNTNTLGGLARNRKPMPQVKVGVYCVSSKPLSCTELSAQGRIYIGAFPRDPEQPDPKADPRHERHKDLTRTTTCQQQPVAPPKAWAIAAAGCGLQGRTGTPIMGDSAHRVYFWVAITSARERRAPRNHPAATTHQTLGPQANATCSDCSVQQQRPAPTNERHHTTT